MNNDSPSEQRLPAIFNPLTPKSPLQLRYAICQLEASMYEELARGGLELREFPLIHSFQDGIYTRSIFLPAGSILVGKLHKHSHPNSILQGCVTVVTEQGGVETLHAPCKMISPAATKRAIYVHTDTIWVVEHEVGPLRDLDDIEDAVIAKSYSQLGMEDPFKTMVIEAQCAEEKQ